MNGFTHGYARYRCNVCTDGVLHEGGWALLAKHITREHPGAAVDDGDVEIHSRPSPAGVVYGGGKR